MALILPGFIVGLREGLEAFLIITLILEYLNKLGRRELHTSVKRGMITGLAVSVILGILLWLLSLTLKESGDAVGKLWEAVASFIAVLFITYFIYWMIKHGRTLSSDIHHSVENHLSAGGLFLLSTVAVAREGAEIALFNFSASSDGAYLTGNLTGVAAAAILSYLIYRSLVKVDIGLIFRITLLYLILQAAYLFGYAVHELLSALKAMGVLDGNAAIYSQLFNLSGTLLDHKKGWLGIALNVLIGWYSKPEIIQAVLQLSYGAVFFLFWRKENFPKSVSRTA